MESEKSNPPASRRKALLFSAAVLLALIAGLEFILAGHFRGESPASAETAPTATEQLKPSPPATDREFFEERAKPPTSLNAAPDHEQARPLTEKDNQESMKKPSRVRIAAAGDIMLQRRVNRSVRQKDEGGKNNFGYDGLFPGLAASLADSDLAIANIEFPIFDERMPERSMLFHGEPPVLDALRRAGFTLLTAANNHSYDHGRISPASTARICRDKGMVCLGVGETRAEARAPHLVEKNGIKLAFVAYSLLYNTNLNSPREDAPHVNGYRFGDLLGQVREAKKLSDCVVVTLHWGQEYRTTPLKWQPGQARQLFEAGACLILGHHPHVLAPIELMTATDGRRCLVIYSLGNFVSNQSGGRPAGLTRLGAILKVDLARTERGVEVAAWDTLPVWVENRDITVEGKRIEDIHVQVVPLMIENLEAELETIEDKEARAGALRQLEFYRGRARQAEKILRLPCGELEAE